MFACFPRSRFLRGFLSRQVGERVLAGEHRDPGQ